MGLGPRPAELPPPQFRWGSASTRREALGLAGVLPPGAAVLVRSSGGAASSTLGALALVARDHNHGKSQSMVIFDQVIIEIIHL